MAHPSQLFARPPEAAVINPANPRVLEAHMGCAAYELPLVPEDREFLGDGIEEAAPALVGSGAARLRDGKLFWARRRAPAPDVNLRSSDGRVYDLVDGVTGDPIGTIEENRAFSSAHRGAVYLHQGATYLVEDMDRDRLEITVREAKVAYYTQPKEEKNLEVVREADRGSAGRFGVRWGTVEVESHVIGYRRKAIGTGEILGFEPLDLPPLRLVTEAFWVVIPDGLYDAAGVAPMDVPGTLHAAEHTGIAMLPLFAICDRWDVGGLSTALHHQTGGGVWFIYDGYAGGAGIAAVGYEHAERHLRATREAIRRCPCATGCPSCVQSPKCGNFNDPLDKEGAARLIAAGLR
jgi:DEAD/DEAH box helicase domain-containing protein